MENDKSNQEDKKSTNKKENVNYVPLKHNRLLQTLQLQIVVLLGLVAFFAIIFVTPLSRLIILIIFFVFVIVLYKYTAEDLVNLENKLGSQDVHKWSKKTFFFFIVFIAALLFIAFYITFVITLIVGVINAILSAVGLSSLQIPIPSLINLTYTNPTLPNNKPYLSIITYNQTKYPNFYHIAIENLGNISSQGLAFYVNTINSSVNISSFDNGVGYINASYSRINSTEVYIIVKSIPIGSWGDININLTKVSKIRISGVSTDGGYCLGYLYSINKTIDSATKRYNGTCSPDIIFGSNPVIITTKS